MANPLRITPNGTALLVHMDDGSVLRAYRTGSTTFVVQGANVKPPVVDPTPDPPDGGGGVPPTPGAWMWPFQYSRYVIQTGTNGYLAQFNMARKSPVTGVVRPHLGLDFGAGGISGLPIPCAADGKVIASAYNSAMGNHVWVEHAGGFVTKYFHMVRTPPVTVGSNVKKGQTLGNVGSTGQSTGAHLHWETHSGGAAVNPRDFMKARGVPES